METWWATLPQNLKSIVQKPWVPRRYCAITKLRTADNMLTQAAFELQELLQERAGQSAPPRWATVERSPEVGQFKRMVKLAAAEVNKLGENWEIDPANGAVYYNRVVVARMLRPANNWEPTTAWATVGTITWEEFHNGLKRAMKE